MAFNIVEAIQEQDADCAFDQPCKFGHRVEGHAVYCHNDAWESGPRKCRRSWYSGGEVKDEDCPGYQPNPEFKGEVNPTPIQPPLCSKCGGSKLFKTDRERMETCPRCMGDGSEPRAVDLTQHQQDTLELCCEHTGKHPAQFDWKVRIAETKVEKDGLWLLDELSLIDIRSVSYTKGDAVAVLYRMTPKGDAVMRANWAAKKSAD
jgi:hypothetical protein